MTMLNYFSNAPLEEGDFLPTLSELDLTGSEGLLVLALAPTCRYCSESMAFYRRLVEERNTNKIPIRIVAVFPEGVGNPSEYLSQHGLVVDQTLTTSFRQLMVKGTPTIFLLNGERKVLKVWAGKLNLNREHELSEEIEILAKSKCR